MKKRALKLIIETLSESNIQMLRHTKWLDKTLKDRNKDLNAAYVERDELRVTCQRLRRENRQLRRELPADIVIPEDMGV